MFALLKNWKILKFNRIESIETSENVLDVVVSLHNMMQLERTGHFAKIPGRARGALGSHIITKDIKPNMKIPKHISSSNDKYPSHWKTFAERMTVILPGLAEMLLGKGKEACFSKRVLKRGENLYLGGNVGQIQCQVMAHDVLRVKGRVYASMKFPVYDCYVELQHGAILLRTACMCKNG
jgi:hypothetical protein